MSGKSRQHAKENYHATPSSRVYNLPNGKCTEKQVGGVARECFSAGLASLPNDFYRKLTGRLIRIAEKIGVPRDEREDVAQEALLEAVKHAEQFQDEYAAQKLCAGLTRQLLHNKAVDALRRLERHAAQSLEDLPAETSDLKEAKRAEREEQKECLEALLAPLRKQEPENYRLMCEHHLQGRSIQELASEMGMTANEIGCRLYRAMMKLRRRASRTCLHGEDPL